MNFEDKKIKHTLISCAVQLISCLVLVASFLLKLPVAVTLIALAIALVCIFLPQTETMKNNLKIKVSAIIFCVAAFIVMAVPILGLPNHIIIIAGLVAFGSVVLIIRLESSHKMLADSNNRYDEYSAEMEQYERDFWGDDEEVS